MERDLLAVFTLGRRAAQAVRGCALSPSHGAMESPLTGAAESALLASVLVDVRDPEWSLLRDVVPLLRNRFAFRPLVGLGIPPELDAEWPAARLLVLSRGLGAPVVRAAIPGSIPMNELARVFSEPLGPGVTCIDSRDIETAFAPPRCGLVFRWVPWHADEGAPMPRMLAEALASERTSAVLVTYRLPPPATLLRLDRAMERLATAARPGADVIYAAPTVHHGQEEALVTVVYGDRHSCESPPVLRGSP